MISVLILNNGGSIVYDTTTQSAESLGDRRDIQFLPLLLTKDMIKANFQDRVNYVESGRKIVAFWEKHGLLYLAQAERGAVPPEYLQHCLATIHRFLRFNHGSQWQENFKQKAKSKLSSTAISNTLSQLPLISETTLVLYSPDMLGCVEQVELHEDLKSRLTEALKDCCDRAFLTTTSSTRFVSLFTPPRRTSSPLKRSVIGKALLGHENSSQQHEPRWRYAFLFANEKLVARCSNTDDVLQDNDNMACETIFFIKCLVLELLKRDISTMETRMDVQPSNDSSRKSISISSLTPSSSDVSQRSSLSYVPDSASSSAPYKISEKSASSVTLSPSNYSPPSLSWASPRQGNVSTRLSRFGVEHPLRSEIKPKHISALLSFDDDRPFINLSSTPPPTEFRRSSDDSSPGSRSRSHSLSEKVSVKQSLKTMMGALMLESKPVALDTSMLTAVKRWIKFGEHVDPCTILLAQITEGLYSAVVFNDRYGSEPSLLGETRNSTGRVFKSYLAESLNDFAAFLLTKASTHFTILSFATTYPGLVHFLHINNGLLMTPTILDLTEFDQNHGLLLELGEKYSEWVGGSFDNVAWSWPSSKRLHEVSQEMIRVASPFSSKAPHCHVVKCANLESKGFRCASLRTQDNQVLIAAYFSFVPDDIMLDMHDKLFHDIVQRQALG